MLDQNERTWRTRSPTSGGDGGRTVERDDDLDGRDSADASTPAPEDDADLTSCPVCEFAGTEYDDVYVHLMTAHRKSTISAALLRP